MTQIQTKQSILKLIKEAKTQFLGTGKSLLDIEDYVAEYLTANGVIVPPCKVGDKVWFLNIYPSICMYRNFVYEAMVVRVYVEHDNELTLAIRIKNEWGTIEYPRIREEIGKTVFLSREEAEKALRERSKE